MFLFLQFLSNDLGRFFTGNTLVFVGLYRSARLVAVYLAVYTVIPLQLLVIFGNWGLDYQHRMARIGASSILQTTRRNPMNTIRLIAIALPVMFLMACGGGGGGGGATATAPTTPPTTMMPPPITAPATPPIGADPQMLPAYLITDLDTARTTHGGTAPDSMTYQDVILTLRTIAADADTLQITQAAEAGFFTVPGGFRIDAVCSGKSCTIDIPDIDTLTFSIDTNSIYDTSLIGNDALDDIEGYNIQLEPVMVDNGITLVQGSGAARQSDGTTFEFQSLIGWADEIAFGVDNINVTENSNTKGWIVPFIFGDASGSNPTGTGNATYNGVIVGHDIADPTFRYEGDATITVDFSAVNVDVSFANLSTSDNSTITSPVTIEDLALENGAFSGNGVEGRFYGSDSSEVGGIFRDSSIFGAFGAIRQP